MNNNTKSTAFSVTLLLVLAFLASTLLLVVTGNPAPTIVEGIIGVFTSQSEMESLFKISTTPIIFTGISVAFAFRGGLFNIGAEGQFMFGSVLGVVGALSVQSFLPAPLTLIFAFLCGALGGAVIGFIPGFLKAIFKVNEVVICIMMNYIALYMSNYVVDLFAPVINGTKSTTTPYVNADVSSQMRLFGSEILRIDLIFAILVIVAFYIIINKTVFGYELRASGLSGDAAKYAGMSVKRNVILTMTLSGAIAGLGGVLFMFSGTSVNATIQPGFVGYGFTGIAVALLGMSTPIGVLLAALLFGILGRSGSVISTLYNPPISKQIANIITGFIIFFIAFQPSVKQKILTRMTLRDVKRKEGGEK